MAFRSGPVLRRPFAILALIGVSGIALTLATVHTIPPRAMTLTIIGATEARIDIYVGGHDYKPPVSLDMLPERDGYINRATDGWNRPLIYAVDNDNTFTLTSLGSDGVPGGAGDDEDIVCRYRIVRNRLPHVELVP